jgi:bifunctional ADP-heptose synthase (sugar kinase/adenylyltransferase)
MALFERDRKTVHIPIYGSDEIADVTGAGDTVIATFTLALAAGASPYEAARLANYAGGRVVMKRGTATVSAGELKDAIEDDQQSVQESWSQEGPEQGRRARN